MAHRVVRLARPIFVLGAVGGVITCFACYGEIVDSVHFYTAYDYREFDQHPIDFGRVPQEVQIIGWTDNAQRSGCDISSGWHLGESNGEYDTNSLRLANHARNLEVKGKFKESLQAWSQVPESANLRAFVQDRRELFQGENLKHPTELQAYLRQTTIIEFGDSPSQKKAVAAIQKMSANAHLQPHIDYAIVELTEHKSRQEESNAYLKVAQNYPNSPRAESALVMAARSLLTSDPKTVPISKEDIENAKKLFHIITTKYPHSRFRNNIQGWLGRCEYLSKDFNKASNYYNAQVNTATTDQERSKGFKSLAQLCRDSGLQDREAQYLLRQWGLKDNKSLHQETGIALRKTFARLNSTQAKNLQTAVRKDPKLLTAYLGFRIEDTTLSPKQEANLATFATSALETTHQASAELLQRVAQLNYNVGHYGAAKRLAAKSIRLGRKTVPGMKAKYVQAASNARLGKFSLARTQYETLLTLNPPPYLFNPAAENLAVLEENHGDPVRAMQLYHRLAPANEDSECSGDVSYMADARLTPTQLKRYALQLPKSEHKNVMLYTLGMRYLRIGQYKNAKSSFQAIRGDDRYRWGLNRESYRELLKRWYADDAVPKLHHPIQIADRLRRWDNLSKHGKTPNVRAKALYDMASYIYRERDLLFYSPGLWKGNRAVTLNIFWSKARNTKSDNAALYRHSYEHECLAHSMQLCDQLIKKYPHSKYVPKALYTRGISAERLSHLNSWWRKHSAPLVKTAVKSMERLAKHYPKNPLAKPAKKYAAEFKSEDRPNY